MSFVAFYVGFKFLFLVFDATDLLERWVFELTPLALMGLPELQLALLSAVVAAANVFFHSSSLRRGQLLGTILTLTMIASLIAALRTSPYYFDAVNLPRFAVLAALLASIPLDHMDLLRRLAREAVRHTPPEAAMWGPEPEVFDQGLETVDEALNALDTAVRGVGADPAQATDAATSMLEGLLADFDAPETGFEVSEVRRRQAIFEKRMKSIDDRLAANAQDADALFAKATYLAMRKEYEKALDLLDQVGVVNAEYPGLWIFKAKIYELMGNLKMAELSLQRAGQQEE